MEEDDKGCPTIRMGVSGWMFFLVPAYRVVPDKRPLNGCVFVCLCVLITVSGVTQFSFTHIYAGMTKVCELVWFNHGVRCDLVQLHSHLRRYDKGVWIGLVLVTVSGVSQFSFTHIYAGMTKVCELVWFSHGVRCDLVQLHSHLRRYDKGVWIGLV